jgi:hypothetical protein
MKIRDLQNKIADALNGCEELQQGHCKAFAEDTLTVLNDVREQLQLNKGVAIVVLTPKATGTGRTDDGGIELDCRVSIKCMEIRAINEKAQSRMTSLQAAENIALLLDSETLSFVNIEESIDHQRSVLVNTVNFDCSITLK